MAKWSTEGRKIGKEQKENNLNSDEERGGGKKWNEGDWKKRKRTEDKNRSANEPLGREGRREISHGMDT